MKPYDSQGYGICIYELTHMCVNNFVKLYNEHVERICDYLCGWNACNPFVPICYMFAFTSKGGTEHFNCLKRVLNFISKYDTSNFLYDSNLSFAMKLIFSPMP